MNRRVSLRQEIAEMVFWFNRSLNGYTVFWTELPEPEQEKYLDLAIRLIKKARKK